MLNSIRRAMYDIVILGAGAAGLTAAVYGARAGRKTCVIENAYAGGQFVITSEIENMPGFKNISGYDLAMLMLEQAMSAGAEIIYNEPIKYDISGDIKSITLSDGKIIEGKNLIIATGAKSRNLGLPNEERFVGKGIHYCATCDGGFYKGKTVAIIGGGKTAVSDAKYLAKLAEKVYIVHRRDTLRAKGAEIESILALSNVEIVYNSVVESILTTDKKLTGLKIKNVASGEINELKVDGVFMAIGLVPNSEPFKTLGVDMTEQGYITVDTHRQTNIKNVYAVGDVTDKDLRQIVTAAADGAIASEWIAENN